MDGKYCVEFAKTGRATCKRCKSSIEKDSVRIGTKSMFQDHETVTWNHSGCFKLPKNMSVDELLVDLVGFHDMDAGKQVEIREAIEANANAAGNKRASAASGSTSSSPVKKSKADKSADGAGPVTGDEDEVYALYKGKTIDELKDFLRWNNQVLKGTKPELVAKCVDGHKHGALPACPEMGCGGRLTADFGIGLVTCAGRFNEERGVFVKCFFKAQLRDITGRTPWRTSPPTAEEKAERQASSASSAKVSTAGTESLFDGLDLYSHSDLKQAVGLLVQAAQKRSINLPKDANVRVASVLMANKDSSPAELLQMLAAEFGTAASTEAKVAASSMGVRCAANEPIVRALSEIAQNMLASGNDNGAMVYRKGAAAIRALDYQVTDGKALNRPKTKVPGIGKKIADLIHAFLETGTMALPAKGHHGGDDDDDEEFVIIDD